MKKAYVLFLCLHLCALPPNDDSVIDIAPHHNTHTPLPLEGPFKEYYFFLKRYSINASQSIEETEDKLKFETDLETRTNILRKALLQNSSRTIGFFKTHEIFTANSISQAHADSLLTFAETLFPDNTQHIVHVQEFLALTLKHEFDNIITDKLAQNMKNLFDIKLDKITQDNCLEACKHAMTQLSSKHYNANQRFIMKETIDFSKQQYSSYQIKEQQKENDKQTSLCSKLFPPELSIAINTLFVITGLTWAVVLFLRYSGLEEDNTKLFELMETQLTAITNLTTVMQKELQTLLIICNTSRN